jgi:hypothetical protein
MVAAGCLLLGLAIIVYGTHMCMLEAKLTACHLPAVELQLAYHPKDACGTRL